MNKFSNCVKVQFEIGHEATLRSEVTPQGFTHDWQVFVRGVDNADIRHFVEKVVFNLHQSFPKPKRVVKEPPYEVRESGYASFTFPIEVYLKSKDDQRKLEFLYDLTLSPTGPVRLANCEKRILKNPSDEFRRKLIRGGGVSVGSDMLPLTDSNSQNSEDKSSSKKSSTSSSDSSKKHKSKDLIKPEETRTSSQFADLFGTPIKTAKLSPTTAPKKSSESKHSSDYKVSSKSTSKHSPHKEREKEGIKKEMMITTSSSKEKDRDRSKEKDKKSDKSLKRPPSPVSTQPPTKTIKEEIKKSNHEEIKDKVKISSEVDKTEKREKKKDKKIREEKDKRDRHKDHENKKELPVVPPPPQPPPSFDKEKEKNIDKTDKVRAEFKEFKENLKRSPKAAKEEKLKEKTEKDSKIEAIEKQRHKHKKKDKNKKDEKDKDKEKLSKKVEKPPPLPQVVPKEPSPQHQTISKWPRSPSPKQNKNPLNVLMSELPSEKETDTESSADEDSKYAEKVKRTSPPPPAPPPPPPPPQPALPPPVAVPAIRSPERLKEDKFVKEKLKKKDKKSSFKEEDGSRKKKRKSKEKEEVAPEKIPKVKEIDEPKAIREESLDDDMDDRVSEPSMIASPSREDREISRSRSPTPPPKFTEEYVLELKDLQRKIMTLEDNAELQRVVQVIAETGQYEITKKTFDFDLCALDKSTVKRLQDLFFAAS